MLSTPLCCRWGTKWLHSSCSIMVIELHRERSIPISGASFTSSRMDEHSPIVENLLVIDLEPAAVTSPLSFRQIIPTPIKCQHSFIATTLIFRSLVRVGCHFLDPPHYQRLCSYLHQLVDLFLKLNDKVSSLLQWWYSLPLQQKNYPSLQWKSPIFQLAWKSFESTPITIFHYFFIEMLITN